MPKLFGKKPRAAAEAPVEFTLELAAIAELLAKIDRKSLALVAAAKGDAGSWEGHKGAILRNLYDHCIVAIRAFNAHCSVLRRTDHTEYLVCAKLLLKFELVSAWVWAGGGALSSIRSIAGDLKATGKMIKFYSRELARHEPGSFVKREGDALKGLAKSSKLVMQFKEALCELYGNADNAAMSDRVLVRAAGQLFMDAVPLNVVMRNQALILAARQLAQQAMPLAIAMPGCDLSKFDLEPAAFDAEAVAMTLATHGVVPHVASSLGGMVASSSSDVSSSSEHAQYFDHALDNALLIQGMLRREHWRLYCDKNLRTHLIIPLSHELCFKIDVSDRLSLKRRGAGAVRDLDGLELLALRSVLSKTLEGVTVALALESSSSPSPAYGAASSSRM